MTYEEMVGHVKSIGYDGVKELGKWKDYTVYLPYCNSEWACFGRPRYVLLDSKGNYRWTKSECEGMKVYDFFRRK